MSKDKTLVLGASEKKDRYSNIAIQSLLKHHHPVIAVGNKAGETGGVAISKEMPQTEDVDTVTLYLNSRNQKAYYEQILALKPNRIIFNPGAENPELKALAEAQGIAAIEACTLVMLSTGHY